MDKIDLESMKISQDFGETGGVRQVIVRIPVRKPKRNEFFRTHTDDKYSFRCALAEDTETRDTYIFTAELAQQFPNLCRPVKLIACIGRSGAVFLWPLKMQMGDRRGFGWNESALQASEIAKTKWVKIAANMAAGAYEVFEATGNLIDPEWPALNFQEMMDMAFDGYIVDDPEHSLIQKLTGRI